MPRTSALLTSAHCEAFFMVSSRTAMTRTGIEEGPGPIQGTRPRSPVSMSLQSSTRQGSSWYRVAALVPLYSNDDSKGDPRPIQGDSTRFDRARTELCFYPLG